MRPLPLTLAAIAATATLTITALPAQAAPSIEIVKIYYDSPGSDRGGNASINGEYIDIRNNTRRTVRLGGWTVQDASRHRYVIPDGFRLGAGKTVRLRSGKGTNTSKTLYWSYRWYVWTNTRDTGQLLNRDGRRMDSCSYTGRGAAYKNC